MRFWMFLVFLASPISAQDLVYSDRHTEACLQEAVGVGERVDCVGASADQCMADTQGGETTVGMGGCLDRELQFWDGRLNAVYGALRTQEKAIDPAMADALRDMQRAWLPYRDARCDYARMQWGGGTGGGPATLSCLMEATAAQVFVLEDSLR